jgi:hypothetical protein
MLRRQLSARSIWLHCGQVGEPGVGPFREDNPGSSARRKRYDGPVFQKVGPHATKAAALYFVLPGLSRTAVKQTASLVRY